MSRPTTLQDIADRVGVARGTVSMALNGKGKMSAETRSRILAAAEEMQYVANTVARNLRASRTGSVGLLFPDSPLSYPYYMDVLYGAVQRARTSNVLVTVLPSDLDEHSSIGDQLDGFIVVDPSDGDPVARRLLSGRRAVVTVETVEPGLPSPWATVSSGNGDAMRALLGHLGAQGARSVLAVLPPVTTAWAREVTAALDDHVASTRLRADTLVLTDAATERDVAAAITRAVSRTPADAVICVAEGAAALALPALGAAGRKVGVDVLLGSYIDSGVLRATSPSVTAIDLRPRAIGEAAADTLLRHIGTARPDVAGVRFVEPELLIRDSTRTALLGR